MVVEGTTDEMYDMVISIYDKVTAGEDKDIIIKLTLLPNCKRQLLYDFLSLVNDIYQDFHLNEPQIQLLNNGDKK